MTARDRKKIGKNDFFGCFKQKKDQHAIIAITVTYVLLIFPRAAFATASSDMKDELGLSNGDLSNILMVQAVAYGFGKACNGMIIDCMDSRYALWFFMILSMISCFGWSFTSKIPSMYPWIFLNMYSQSAMWPCMAKLIYNWFDSNSWSKGFSYLAISARVGTFFTLLVLGFVISISDWRWTLRTSSIVIGLGFIYSYVIMRNHAAPPIREEDQALTKDVDKVGCCKLCSMINTSKRFWLVLIGTSTMSVMTSITSIMPIWLTDVFRPCTDTDTDNCKSLLDSGHASIVSSLVPLGLICSLIYGRLYMNDSGSVKGSRKEAKITIVFLVCATLLVVMFAAWSTAVESGERPKHDPGNWVGGLAVFFFIYGFFVGYPYYIPPSVYAIRTGGGNAATLTAILDLGGLILVTAFVYFGTTLSEAEGVSETALTTWRYAFYCFTMIAIVATVSMAGYLYLHLRLVKRETLPKEPEVEL